MTLSALQNNTIQVQGPDNKLDFSNVLDVADAFVRASTMVNAKNKVFNCTRGRGRKIIDAAELVKKELGFGKIITKPHDPFYPNRDTLNSDKIKIELGWQPQIDIEQGIKDYIKWLLAQDFLDHYTKK
jgi:nucleoside-diphosphate-sugar epimerase